MLYFLNSPVISNWGEYRLTPVTKDESVRLWESAKPEEKISAIGHEETSLFLNLLGFGMVCNRISIKMKTGDRALVLKINGRLPEGKLLTKNDLNNIDYEFGLLECLRTF
jgi:hypothetical protein